MSPRNSAKIAVATGNLNRYFSVKYFPQYLVKIDFKFVQTCDCVICFYCLVNIFSDVGKISCVEPLLNSE